MKTMRARPRAASGYIRSSSATFVIGASGTSVTGSPRSAASARTARSSSTACRGSAVRVDGGRPEVAHPVVAVHVPCLPGRLEERAARAAGDGDVGTARGLEHEQGVRDDLVERGVPRDARHRAQVEPRVPGREQEGARVVHPGVDVEDDRATRSARAARPLLLGMAAP